MHYSFCRIRWIQWIHWQCQLKRENSNIDAKFKVVVSLSKLLIVNGSLSSLDGEEFFDILLKGNKFSNSNKHYQQMTLYKMSIFYCVSFHF